MTLILPILDFELQIITTYNLVVINFLLDHVQHELNRFVDSRATTLSLC